MPQQTGLFYALEIVFAMALNNASDQQISRFETLKQQIEKRFSSSLSHFTDQAEIEEIEQYLGEILENVHQPSHSMEFPETKIDNYLKLLDDEGKLQEIASEDIERVTVYDNRPISDVGDGNFDIPDKIHGKLNDWFKRITGEVPNLNSELLELGLDSLHFLALIHEMDLEFGVEINEDDIAHIVSVRDLFTLIAKRASDSGSN
ncbi:MAG: acyl carrier protein [Pseudomonadota bacterium]